MNDTNRAPIRSFRVHALLKTGSPLHIAAPSSLRYNPVTGKVTVGNGTNSEGDKDGSIACTGIQRQKMVFLDEEGMKSDDYPMIAGNNIAGRLRRHAARHLLDHVCRDGAKVPLPVYGALMCGAVTGKPDKADLKLEQYLSYRRHPYLGLFGGGPRLLRRNVRVHNALPVTERLTELAGDLSHPYGDAFRIPDDKVFTLVSAVAFRHNDDLRALVDVEYQDQRIENYEQAIRERQAAILEDAANNGESRFSTLAFTSMEYVLPGTVFNLTFELEATEAQLGLFLLALQDFAHERLGGAVRNGYGVISLNEVLIVEGDQETRGLFNNNRLDTDAVAPFLRAWEAEAERLDLATLNEHFYVHEPRPKKTAAPAKKKAKVEPVAAE